MGEGDGRYAVRGLGDEGPDGVKTGEGFPSSVGFLEYQVALVGGDSGFGYGDSVCVFEHPNLSLDF